MTIFRVVKTSDPWVPLEDRKEAQITFNDLPSLLLWVEMQEHEIILRKPEPAQVATAGGAIDWPAQPWILEIYDSYRE